MANTVSLLSYANTFGDWVVTTNFLAQQNNNFVANNYVKSTGTLYLNDPTLGLQVANAAIFAGSMQVQGLGSSASIQNTLSVGGLATFSNTTQSITTLGPVTTGGQLSATGSGVGLYVANNATVNGILTVSQNTNVTGALTVFGAINLNGVTSVSNTFSTTGAATFGSTGAFTGAVTAPSFTAATSMATQYLSVSNPAGATVNGSSIITAATYNTYAPSLTGTGASGTWPISITGNASGTANAATNVTGGSVFAANVTSTGVISGTQLTTSSGSTAQFGGSAVTGVYFDATNVAVRAPTTGSVFLQSASGTSTYSIFGSSGQTLTGALTATGNITAYYSDERLKKKLGLIEKPLDKLMTLNGFYYEANEIAQALGYKPKREVGLSAQEVQAILPEIVSPAPIDPQYLTIDYERLVPLLIESIKELKAEIDELKKK